MPKSKTNLKLSPDTEQFKNSIQTKIQANTENEKKLLEKTHETSTGLESILTGFSTALERFHPSSLRPLQLPGSLDFP